MTLEQLGLEYMDRWKSIMERIKEISGQLSSLPPERRRKATKRLNSLLASAKSCKETADHLINYYKNSKDV